MSPRQVLSWVSLIRRRRKRDNAELLGISALGARGEPAEVKRLLEKWQD